VIAASGRQGAFACTRRLSRAVCAVTGTRSSPTIDVMAFDRITAAPDTLEGKPCVRGLRISVETVVRLVAAGWAFDEILAEYPDLEREDITQALQYAAAATNVHLYTLREPA
jgi:uncharacterized protein (DUF433 family)